MNSALPDPVRRRLVAAFEAGDETALDELVRAHPALAGELRAAWQQAARWLTDLELTEVGPYEILRPIGEGGMGTVYLAEQREPVHRRVALKMVKPGMGSRSILRRRPARAPQGHHPPATSSRPTCSSPSSTDGPWPRSSTSAWRARSRTTGEKRAL